MDDVFTVTVLDTQPPDAVTDLTTGSVSSSSVQLTWTAPGDDGATGTASTYDVRYSTSTITEGNWAAATQASGEPSPKVAGSGESFTVTGLSQGTTYHFAIKTSDEVPNQSAISNVPSVATIVSASVTYQKGDGKGSVSETDDAKLIDGGSAGTNYGSTTDLEIDSGDKHSVVKFPNIFGGGADQIPLGSVIVSATLTLQVFNQGDDPLVYQLIEGWVESQVTYNDRITAVGWSNPGAGGTGSHKATADGSLPAGSTGSRSVDVTTSVQNWSDGEVNEGWVLEDTGSDGVDIRTSEYATVAERPMLSVTYLPGGDQTAPNTVTDLATGAVTATTVDLSWTAPGDDGATGTATGYDIRYSTSTITEGNWASATQATGEPSPQVAGSAEGFTVTGLSSDITYYFAIKTSDEIPNESAISNVPSAATPDITAPDAITDLATGTVTITSVQLNWTAPGDDGATGTATTYDVRYSTSTINDGNWAAATQATGEPAPQVASSAETFTVTGLSPSTTYYFAIKTSDEVPNESALSNVPSAATLSNIPSFASGGQKLHVGQPPVPIRLMTLTDATGVGTFTDANDLRIRIPATFNMIWDTLDVDATIGGGASAKVSSTVSYEDGGKTLVLNVLTDFLASEQFTVVDLSFMSFTAVSAADKLELEVYNDDVVTTEDTANKEIIVGPSISSRTNQTFMVSDPATAADTITITESPTDPVITAGDEIRIRIPAGFNMIWDTGVTTVTIGGGAAGNMSTTLLAYEDGNKTAVLDVTTNFAVSDVITVVGLTFTTFSGVSAADSLELELENDGVISAEDDKTIEIIPDAVAPNAVADLATGTLTTSSVALSWTAPGDDGATGTATTYDVRYSTSTITAGNWATATQAAGEPAPSVAGSAETFTVTGLSESTTYFFAIKTSDEVPNESAISNVPSATTADGTAPDDVTDLATGTVTTSSVQLSWTAPGDDGATGTATSYDVRYSTSTITAGNWATATQAAGEPAPSVAGSAETFTVTGLSESTTYFFAIKTSDEVPNESAISNVPSAATADGTAPDDVTDLATGTVTTSSVQLSWTAPGDDGATGTATTYDVRYSTSTITAGNWASATQATGEPAPSVAGSAETFTVTGLSESTTYFFAIKTSDEVPNESAISNVPSATTADGTAPDAVTDLATGTVTTSSVALSWTAPGDDGATGTATTYDVRYSTSTITAGNWASATQATGEPAPAVAGSAETFTVTGLSESTTYFFAIKTSDEVPNESAISNVPSATTADGTAPDAVADLATGTVTGSSVALSWTAPGDDGATGTATSYDVRYSTSTITAGNWATATQAAGEPAPAVAGSAETFTVTGLSESTTYFFAIKTSDEVPNESAISNVPSAATADGTAPDAVADLATGTVTTSSVALSWTAPGDDGATGTATSYDVRYSTSTITAGNWASATQAAGEPAPAVAGSAETFTVTGLSESTTYFFAIKTSDEVPNESAISNVPSATTADGTAPDAVTDLATGTVTTSSVALSWTAPGDDGATGTATTYDVRYSTSTITAGNWASATQATGEPAPSVAGSAETFTVTGLSESTTYFFAIKTSDEVPNESALSNVPSATTADATAPDAVTDLATGTVMTSSVQLSWTAPGDDGATGTATSYDVRYSTSTITAGNWATATQATGEPAPAVAGSAETFTVTGLSASTTYFFAIKTSDEVPNESALSNVPSATTADATAPDAVTDLATGTVTTSSVQLSWTAPGDDGATGTATSYDVRYSTSTITAGNWATATQAAGEPAPAVAGSAETFTVTGLSESTTYFFAIKTSDEVPNESAISNVPSAATADATAPAAVTDLATGTVTTSSVALSWTAPGDDGATGTATSYDVRYSTSTITAGNWATATQATGEPAPAVAGSAETFTVTGLSASTTYFFAIKTSDEVPNESVLSNVPSATTADATAPDAVTDLATGTVTTSSVQLSWTAPGDDGATGTATSYDVRYSTSTITAGNWASATQATAEPAPSVAGSAETFTVTGLSASTTYFFAIKTSDEVPNESALSNVPSATTADATAPAAVTDLATGTVTTSSVQLSWTAPGDDGATGTATSYDVRYSTSTITAGNWASATQATAEPAPSVAGSAETFTVTGLSASTTYFFAIKTSDEVPNESALSNVPSAATADGTAPDAVTDLATGTVTTSSVALSWTAPGDDGATGTATTYDVRYSTSTITAGNWATATQATGEPAPSVAGSAETFTVTGLSASTTYFFAIKTSDEVPNESALSNVPSATTADATAPAAVTDLATGTVTGSSVALSWTAPGDDGATGTATTYDVRYSTSTITAGNWATATQATAEPAPSVAGSAETFTVTGLSASTTYFFAIKTSDEVPNESALSNVPSAATSSTTYAVAVTPDTTAVSRLPSNGTNYTVDFTVVNGGSGTDDFDLLTTQGPGTAITVVSITGTGVTQGGNPDSARVSPVAAAATAIVTVTYSVGDAAAGVADTLFFTARSVGDPVITDNGRLELTVIRPNLTTGKGVSPTGTQLPGTELTYTVTITNDGSDDATGVVVTDSVAVELDFKVGSVVNNLPSGVTATVEYSNDAGSSWTYTPVSAGCGAPANFDSCVTHIRWTLDNDLSYVGPDNTGNVEFVARIQ